MSDKVIVTGIEVSHEQDPWDVGMVTERLPALELYEDGIEDDDSLMPTTARRDRAAQSQLHDASHPIGGVVSQMHLAGQVG